MAITVCEHIIYTCIAAPDDPNMELKFEERWHKLIANHTCKSEECISFWLLERHEIIYTTRKTKLISNQLISCMDISGLIPTVRLCSWSAPASYHNNSLRYYFLHKLKFESCTALNWFYDNYFLKKGVYSTMSLSSTVPCLRATCKRACRFERYSISASTEVQP